MAKKRLFSAVIMVAALLLVSHNAANEQLQLGDNLRHENVLLPLSTPDKPSISFLPPIR
jgi:hypothetical protein